MTDRTSSRTRVYYEDTDLAGIVYYANYLKFIERARTEWVEALGVDQVALKARDGIVFAVRRVEADYLRPAKFADELVVETRLQSLGGARIVLEQVVLRGGERLFASVVTLVCLARTVTRRGCRRRCGRSCRGRCTEAARGPRGGLPIPDCATLFAGRADAGDGGEGSRMKAGRMTSPVICARNPAGHRLVLAFPLHSC
jgi:acyl-CoA thioester hydrolase